MLSTDMKRTENVLRSLSSFFYKRCIYADECFLVYITPLCLLMIPLAREDGEGAIDRLEQYYLHKLVREGEL